MSFNFYSNGIQWAGSGGGDLPENVVTTDAEQTLLNKTISATNNNILNLNMSNFAEDAVRTSVRGVDEASDSELVTEKAVSRALGTYIHDQAVSSDTWVITHNLGKFPSVFVVDSAGTQFLVQVTYDSLNQITLSMNNAMTGKAYLN